MRKNSLVFLFTALFAVILHAQSPISLSNSNLPGSGDTLRYSVANPASVGNYTQTGTNFTWNFSNLVPISQGLREYKLALQTAYAFYFLSLNEYGELIDDTLGAGPLTITNFYNFYKKQTTPVNAYVVDGAGMTFSSIPVPSYYSDKDELYHFPLTYPKYDSTTFKFSTSSSTLIPIRYIKTGYRVTKVDGWGSITTPYGTANCLRLVTTQYSQDTIKNNLIPFPLGFANNQRSYQWLTTTSKIPFLEINGSLVGNNFTITQVRYRDIYRVITGMNEQENNDLLQGFYPNPVNHDLSLTLAEPSKIQIFDLSGRSVLNFENQVNMNGKVVLNVSDLPQGVYHVTISSSERTSNFKFIKQ